MSTEYHFCISQVGKFKEKEHACCWQEPGETGFFWRRGGGAHGQPSGESVGLYITNHKMHILFGPMVLLLGRLPKNNQISLCKRCSLHHWVG